MKTTFKCQDCKQEKPVLGAGVKGYCGGTGYARFGKSNRKVCYECCAERDRKYMVKHGRIMLYLSKKYEENEYYTVNGVRVRCLKRDAEGRWYHWTVSNWPGSLVFTQVGVQHGRHNIARTRCDVWFDGPDGFEWHGVQYGEWTQIVHCRRTKKRSAGSKAVA